MHACAPEQRAQRRERKNNQKDTKTMSLHDLPPHICNVFFPFSIAAANENTKQHEQYENRKYFFRELSPL
jgi:hypothetical protein